MVGVNDISLLPSPIDSSDFILFLLYPWIDLLFDE